MAERPYFLEPGSVREDWRLGVAALFASGSGVRANPGVVSGMVVAQTTTASGSVTVTAGWCVNQATSATGGAFLEPLDSQATLDVFGTNPPESSPRNDLIVYQSGASPKLRVVKGSASATPTDPAVPSQAVVLARVRVKAASAYGATPAIVSGDIDDLRTMTNLRGRPPQVDVFTTSGTFRLPAGATAVWVRLWGAGGGGGVCVGATSGQGQGGGGGGGGYVEGIYPASSLSASSAVTVGTGGSGASFDGDPGGSTTWGSLAAGGGAGGLQMTSTTGASVALGGTGGTASGGNLVNAAGSDGGHGRVISGVSTLAATGGSAGGPGGGQAKSPTNPTPQHGNGPGGGGAGAFGAASNTAAGNGANGRAVFVTFF